MRGNRDSLERGLREAWSFEELAVYGDVLQSEGDPRGDVIALDLRPMPDDPAWWAQRQAALDAWLGAPVATDAGALVQHGFVPELRYGSHPADVLDGPLGTYVRGYAVWGTAERIGQALAELASRPRPWLERLTIVNWSADPCADALSEAVVAAAPHVEELHLVGQPAFRSLPLRALKRVWLDERIDAELAREGIEQVRRRSHDHGTGWIMDEAEREALRTCDPLTCDPVLLARASAAGFVERRGPVCGVPERRSDRTRSHFVAGRATGNLYADAGVATDLCIGNLAKHGEHVGHLIGLELPVRHHLTLVAYAEILQSLADAESRLARQRTIKRLAAPLCAALNGLVELRGLPGLPRHADPAWEAIESFAALLASPGAQRRVELRVG